MKLFVLGLGYSATLFANRLLADGWQVGGTTRSPEKSKMLQGHGIEAVIFDMENPDCGELATQFRSVDALLVSVPPGADGAMLPRELAEMIAEASPQLRWIGYLSTIGVYGDHGGAWIDEATDCRPMSERSRARLAAEASWTGLGQSCGKPVIVFRLPGIYGPSRNAIEALRSGTARRIVKPGQVFNRIHVADIATALSRSIIMDQESAIYNLTDDEPSPPQDVIAYAAKLLGVDAPPEIAFEEAKLSPMAASFYAESKRVRNALIKRALAFSPAFPSYREGLRAILDSGTS
jgi:nucleoside-diphosphate-sugar epimerase